MDLRSFLKGDKAKATSAMPAETGIVTLGPGDVLYIEVKQKPVINRDNMLGLLGLIPAILWAIKGL